VDSGGVDGRRTGVVAAAESVAVAGSDDGSGGSPGVAFRRRGWKSRETEGCPRRSLVPARTCTPGWPGVLPWKQRSRLDIDKWLAEGELNTAPLLHMQGHPFVRTWARGKERTVTVVAAATTAAAAAAAAATLAAEGMNREGETPTTAGDRRRRPPATTSPPASGLLCYPDGIMPHSSCLLGNGSHARPVYAPLMNGASNSRDYRHRDITFA